MIYRLAYLSLVSQMLAAQLECVLAQFPRSVRNTRPAVLGMISALGVSYLLPLLPAENRHSARFALPTLPLRFAVSALCSLRSRPSPLVR